MEKKGFTLVELLVVAAILAILAGIVMDVVRKMRPAPSNDTEVTYVADNNEPNASGGFFDRFEKNMEK